MRRVLLFGSVLLAVLVAGCTSGDSGTADLPAASGLLTDSGTAMKGVTSVHFTIAVDGTLAGVPIQNADGDLNAQGQAKGNAKITELGETVQVDFVLVNKTFYLKGPTGGYTKVPAALAGNLFDPTAILDPNRGVAKVLTSVRGASTQAKENVDGVDCYKIGGKVDKGVVAALVPGIGSDVDATVWVAADGKHLPVKAEFAVPGKGGAQGATVDVDISHVNEPVTVTAPA
ncbi:MAG TPA: LppX_LprAFG lipoprotein [Pseudonocardiaceae bacterium]|jgi:lipoprotein LprG|nr:LppX_LprAFG lipoprotein [Pseudonocardiaceae bacterium]